MRSAATRYFWKIRELESFLTLGSLSLLAQSFLRAGFNQEALMGWAITSSLVLLPKLSGLYSKEMLVSTNLHYAEPEIDCVFISHAHFDHITHIEFLDPAIPVCMGVGTKLFMESMEEMGFFVDYGVHPCNKFRTGHKIKNRRFDRRIEGIL